MRVNELTRHLDGTLPAYAWPGGYPLIYTFADGGICCAPCANGDNGSDASTAEDTEDMWRLYGADIHYEGPPEVCDHCYADIESAYGDPNTDAPSQEEPTP